MEAALTEEEEKEAGMETLLGVMAATLSEQQKVDLEANLGTCRDEIFRLERQLDRLYDERGDGEEATEGEADAPVAARRDSSDYEEASGGAEVRGIKKSIKELNRKITELKAELEFEKKNAAGAMKLFKLAQMANADNSNPSSGVDLASVEAEAMRHQQLVTTKELFVDGLQAEREGLLSQVPDEYLDDELIAELEKDAAEEEKEEATAAKEEKMAKKRIQVVGEILQTEEDFLNDMILCREGYLESAHALTAADVDVDSVFSNVGEVIEVSAALCQRLRAEGSAHVEDQAIGTVFVENSTALRKAYVT